MGLSVSLLLATAGAILYWAVDRSHWGALNLDVAGVILIVVGALGIPFYPLAYLGGNNHIEVTRKDPE